MSAFEPDYSTMHGLRMEIPELLRAIADAAKVKQTGLGKLIGVTQPQISRYMKGAQPKKPAYDKIIAAGHRFGVGDSDVRTEDVAHGFDEAAASFEARSVPVRGYVGAGATAHYLPLAGDELDRVPAPPGATDKTIALEIRGTSLGELFDRWLVFVDDVRTPVTPDLVGKTCVVGLTDDRVLI